MKLLNKFKDIVIEDYDLIQEIEEIRDRRSGFRVMLNEISKLSGKAENDNSKWWEKIKKIYKLDKDKENKFSYDFTTHTITIVREVKNEKS